MGKAHGIAAILGLALGCTASADDPSVEARQRCTDLRDHVVDLRLNDVGDPGVDLAAHRAAMQQALGDHFIDGCMNDLSEAQKTCVTSATDSQALAACTDSH